MVDAFEVRRRRLGRHVDEQFLIIDQLYTHIDLLPKHKQQH